jgi:hypothetical protein
MPCKQVQMREIPETVHKLNEGSFMN